MDLDFSPRDHAALCGMLAGTPSDILLKTDVDGFIVQASQGLECLGAPVPDMLVPPRLLDLVAAAHVDAVEAEHALAAAGSADRGWTEFLAGRGPDAGRWFALKFSPQRNGAGKICGVLAIMRNVDERRRLEDRLFAARMTDPLTGLTNRIAFAAMLRHLCGTDPQGCLALFTVDRFRALNHRLGHAFGDELLVGFAQVLRTVMRTGDVISRVGDARFAVLLPGTDDVAAAGLCREVQEVFAGEATAGQDRLPLSATAGIAEIGSNAEDTLRRAEMASVLGKARGAGRVEGEPRRYRPPVRATLSAAGVRQRLAG